MTRLSVNINKVATLRNARGGDVPNVVKVALDCEDFGADGITVHPRPDERHIRRKDVYDLRPLLRTEFNIEGYPAPEFMDLVLKVKPHQVTLVPDSPTQLTSNAGWDTKTHFDFLNEVLDEFNNAGIRTSVFVSTQNIILYLIHELGVFFPRLPDNIVAFEQDVKAKYGHQAQDNHNPAALDGHAP